MNVIKSGDKCAEILYNVLTNNVYTNLHRSNSQSNFKTRQGCTYHCTHTVVVYKCEFDFVSFLSEQKRRCVSNRGYFGYTLFGITMCTHSICTRVDDTKHNIIAHEPTVLFPLYIISTMKKFYLRFQLFRTKQYLRYDLPNGLWRIHICIFYQTNKQVFFIKMWYILCFYFSTVEKSF